MWTPLRWCLVTLLIGACAPPTAPVDAPVVLPLSRFRDIRSTTTGDLYRVFLSVPATPPPAAGFPVVYLLDASWYFATAAEPLWLGAAVGQYPAAILVGIGYQHPGEARRRRMKDLTLPMPEGMPVPPPAVALSAEIGGADAFREFIRAELKPLVASIAPVNSGCEVLIGHSLGGLFAVHTLLSDPRAFDAYAIGDPSIWWGGEVVMNALPAFQERARRDQLTLRVLVAQSSLSGPVAAAPARRLADSLAALPGITSSWFEFADETHNSMIPGFLARSLRHGLGCATR